MDTAVVVIMVASFVAAFVNAAFATGGVYIILLAATSVLPVSAAIPLQSVLSVGSLLARIYYFWEHIDWRIVRTFVLGGCVGVYFGTRTFAALPESTIAISLGIVLLILIWMPKFNWHNPIKHPFLFVGVVHSYFGSLFGVGGVLQPFMLRSDLLKLQITSTLAVCLISLDVLKVWGYTSFGFSYFDYIPHIVGASITGVMGTWVGKRATHLISEKLFRRVFKVLVSLVALRLIYKGLAS